MGNVGDRILHPPFSPDRRGLISELVRRLAECEGLSDAGLSEILGKRLGRAAGPLPEVIESWRTGRGGPPPGDVLTVVLEMAHKHPELAALIDALIGPGSDAPSEAQISQGATTTVDRPAIISAATRDTMVQPDETSAVHSHVLLPGHPVATSLGGAMPNISANEPVSHAYIAAIRRTIQQFIDFEIQMGSNELAPLALRYLRSVRRRLDAGQYETLIEQELQAALAELAQLVAWLLHDAGWQDDARQAAYEALHLARLAGSPQQLDLFILGNLAHVEIFTGRPRAALQIARTALGTNRLSSRLMAMFRIREARALAQLGDGTAAKRALETARSELLDGVTDRDPPWSWWLDEPEFVHHSGQVFASLGVHDRALSLLEQANEDCPSTRVSGRFIYLAHSLAAAVEAKAWSDVEFIIEQTMPYASEVGSGRAANVLLAAAGRLDQLRATPDVHDAGRHLRAVLVTSTRSTHTIEGSDKY